MIAVAHWPIIPVLVIEKKPISGVCVRTGVLNANDVAWETGKHLETNVFCCPSAGVRSWFKLSGDVICPD